MARASFIFFTFSFLYASVSAQDFFYSTRNYTAIDGLPQSQVRALVEDKSGYLWIGTEGGGLARFDGREFKVYTTLDGLLTNQVLGLRLDNDENLWILHPRGVTKFDGRRFTKIQAPSSQGATTIQPIRRAYQLSDTLFLLSTNGLESKIYKDSVYYWEKETDKNKQVWFSHTGPGGEVCLFLSDSSFRIRTETQSYSIPVDLEQLGKIYNVFNYKRDVLFKSMKGMFRLDLKTRTIEKLDWEVPHYVLLYDEKEDKFWTTNGAAFFREKIKGEEVKTDTILKDININQVLIDSEGNTWFASNGNGLYKYFIQDFIRCSSERMRGVMAIVKDREGASWIGTMNKGLWRIRKGKISSYFDEKESYRNMIHCIKESPNGTIWIGTSYGLGRYDKDEDKFHWFSREDGLPGYSVMGIEFDDKGMWVATGNGLSFYDGKSFKNYSTRDGLAANGISTLHYLKKLKTLFIGTEVALNTLKDGKFDLVSIPEMINTSIISLHPYQDSLLLIGTGGTGVVVLNPVTNRRKLITTRDGMASDFVYFAASDEKGYVWIGTEKVLIT